MYGLGQTAQVYVAANMAIKPFVVQREYDGFKAEVGETLSYAQAIKWVKEYGLSNDADYYATIRIIRDGVVLETYDFPPGWTSPYKGD
jgi:hypothetical protein